ncbi:MAG: class I SAM-dependent methyltransferase [Pseudomonadota bacterium]
MTESSPKADTEVNSLYENLRAKHGSGNSRANGYLWHGYFLREQEILFSLMNPSAQVVLDVGCGSGLMVSPLRQCRELVAGIDFNEHACADAQMNGLAVTRGDAFELPYVSNSIDELVCCQFFNQQPQASVIRLLAEAARVLSPNGRVILIWRNGEAHIHRAALFLAKMVSAVNRGPLFPYENHSIDNVIEYAQPFTLVAEYCAVSFPPMRWVSEKRGGWGAKFFGASNICVLSKPPSGVS